MNQSRQLINQTFPKLAHSHDSDKRETAEKLVEAIGGANDILVQVETFFPLTLFPTTLTVDRTKVSITERNFFKSGEVLSIRIEDILNVTAQVGPFFGSIRISTRFFNPDKPYIVAKLKRGDALKVKRILQGYLIARQNKIDSSKLTITELSRTLDELGKVGPRERV